ncbi:MAG TPA: insulinase family protein, partial [Candidatus Hydrogenedentes bacterium]|nr:insulinase family protein [Candidatus Hydrogenedentota bacterium]
MVNQAVIFCVLSFAVILAADAWPADSIEAGRLDYQEIVLDNGLCVVTLEDFSCPIVVVDLWYHVGSKDEDPERQGFAHMFEHMMFRGTDRLGPTDHFDNIRRIGGHCNGYTSFDQTVYVQTVPANQLELALWLEAERMSFLKIDQEAFDTERKVVEEERRMGLNAPYGALFEKALAEVFKEHPYRWSPIGNIPHLRATSVPELRSFWMRYYAPNNATLIIAGAVKHDEAQRLAKRYFEWIPRSEEQPRITIREPLPEAPRDVTLKLDNAPLPLVAIAYRTVPLAHPDRAPLELLTTIIGEGNSSRIHRSLVAEKELSVGVQCMNICLEQDGVLALGAALPAAGGDMDEALAALQEEVGRVRSRKVRARELEKAKNQKLRGLVTENLYVANKARILGSAAVLEGDTARVNRRLDAIRSATADDLLRVAKTYLDPDKALTFRIKRNLKGLFKKDEANPEDDAPVTGVRETEPPPPGRPGAMRPGDYPETSPVKEPLAFDPTPRYQSHTLENGLKVVVIENREIPYVSMSLQLYSGAWTETKPGCAALAMRMLKKGTKAHDEGELADELETYAISLSGWAGMDDAAVSASCVTDQLERATDLMAEVVLAPTFDPGEFEKLRKQVLADLRVSSVEPFYLADKELRHRLCGEHPYARTVQGEVEDVKALTPDDLKTWWNTFARPDMAWLCFAGDIGLERAVRLAEKMFGSWEAGGPKPEIELPPLPQPAATHIYLVEKSGDQAQIRIGQRGLTRKEPDYFTSNVVSSYFGGAFGSRLNDALRVKKGLTYGSGGGYSSQRLAGAFRAYTFTKLDSTADAILTMLEEIQRLRNEPPTPEELGDTKAYILGSFAGQRETPQSLARDLWLIESEGLPEDYFKTMLESVRETDADACVAFAQRALDPENLVIVVVGP